MRLSRRRFFAVGLALAAAAGCDSKKDATPNPDLGPPPTGGPPKRDAPPEGTKKKAGPRTAP
jgi:hypothetical protein